MSPMHGPTQEHLRFLAAKAIIERARARAGVRLPPYTRAQWDREQQQLRASVARKRRIQRVAMFESRIHGVKLTEAS
jgi:hypothetical protein